MFEISSSKQPTSNRIRVATVRGALTTYRVHPEAKSTDQSGAPCARSTVGLLGRRPVSLKRLHYIGKESNELDEQTAMTTQATDEPQTEYTDPNSVIEDAAERQEWVKALLFHLREQGWTTSRIALTLDIDRKTIQRYAAGKSIASADRTQALESLLANDPSSVNLHESN